MLWIGVLMYTWRFFPAQEERLAFIRTIFPGIMIDLTLCWESCVPHGGDPDHPDRGPGTDEQNLREAWIVSRRCSAFISLRPPSEGHACCQPPELAPVRKMGRGA